MSDTAQTTTYQVTGMTCGHCVSSVTQELQAIDGVQDVAVELDPKAASTVTVTSVTALTDEQVAAALGEAGDYHLATTA